MGRRAWRGGHVEEDMWRRTLGGGHGDMKQMILHRHGIWKWDDWFRDLVWHGGMVCK